MIYCKLNSQFDLFHSKREGQNTAVCLYLFIYLVIGFVYLGQLFAFIYLYQFCIYLVVVFFQFSFHVEQHS